MFREFSKGNNSMNETIITLSDINPPDRIRRKHQIYDYVCRTIELA